MSKSLQVTLTVESSQDSRSESTVMRKSLYRNSPKQNKNVSLTI